MITPDIIREQRYSRDVTLVNYIGTVEVLEIARRNNIKNLFI